MKSTLLLLLTIAAIMLASCAGSNQIGTERIVERSGSTPGWVNKPTQDKDGYYFVTGVMTDARDQSFGTEQAYADGVRNIMNMMTNAVKTQSTQALRGANMSDGDVGRFSEFAVAWVSDTYKISGVENPESYWEKVQVTTPTGVKYHYNCYTLLRISKVNFDMALQGAFDNMKKKAQELNNKKAEEVSTQLLGELKKQQSAH